MKKPIENGKPPKLNKQIVAQKHSKGKYFQNKPIRLKSW